jgi:hypothetical protein
MTEIVNEPNGLVGKDGLLEQLFPNPKDRPTTRWLDQQCNLGTIPFMRVGRLIWFDLAQVKQAFLSKAIKVRKQ